MKNNFSKVVSMLSHQHKSKGVLVLCMLVVSSLLDFISLAVLMPLIFVVIDPQQTSFSDTLLSFQNKFTSQGSFVITLTIAAIVFIAIKNQINSWIAHFKANYAYDIASDLGSRSLTTYLHSSYYKFTNTDYTTEMNRISNLPLTFANNILIPVGTIISESIVAVLLIVAVALYNFKVLSFLALLILQLYY
jgi:ATP-binding cassette, subfamily B, bacterial PglK